MTTNAAAMPSLNVTTSIPFSTMRARKKLIIGCVFQMGATTEAGA